MLEKILDIGVPGIILAELLYKILRKTPKTIQKSRDRNFRQDAVNFFLK